MNSPHNTLKSKQQLCLKSLVADTEQRYLEVCALIHYHAAHRESCRKLALLEFPVRPSDGSPLFLETWERACTQTSCGTTNNLKGKRHTSFLLVFFCLHRNSATVTFQFLFILSLSNWVSTLF